MPKANFLELPRDAPLVLLSERQRRVLLVRQHHTRTEAAQILKMPKNTLSNVEQSALQRLRLAQGRDAPLDLPEIHQRPEVSPGAPERATVMTDPRTD